MSTRSKNFKDFHEARRFQSKRWGRQEHDNVQSGCCRSVTRGIRTLVIDLDAQANSTRYLLGEQADTLRYTAADFFDQMLNFQTRPNPTEDFIVQSNF